MLTKQIGDTKLFAALGVFCMAETPMIAPQQDIGGTDGSFIAILVDSGSSDHFIETDLHPGLKEHMVDYETLKGPHKIITAGASSRASRRAP